MASELAGYIGILPWYRKRRKNGLQQVLSELIGISNGFFVLPEDYDTIKANKESEEKIKKMLKVK